jgi:hypothetical protein
VGGGGGGGVSHSHLGMRCKSFLQLLKYILDLKNILHAI